MKKPEFILFFDNHTQHDCYDVGHNFNAENFADNLVKIGADYIGFHARCNQGFAYYDTKIGTRHPSLREGHDLFGEVVEACKKRNIGVSAYFNCGLSNEDGVNHPEWCKITPDSQIFHKYVLNSDITPYMRIMCINSPYRDHLLKMIAEVKEKYPVSGFLFDSFNSFPCVCKHCIEGMRKAGLDHKKPEDVQKFARMSDLRLAEDICKLIEPRKNNYMTFYLGVSARNNLKFGSYLECECLPTVPCWGYDFLPAKSRYLRTLVTDEPVLNMTGRFYNWGDFGSLRTDAALEYDLFYGLANGMRPNIGDHFIPDGTYHKGIVDRLSGVYGKLKQYNEWFKDAKNPVDIALLLPGMATTNTSKAAVRMLSELNMQFDCIDEENSWDKYKVVILPDNVVITEQIREKLAKHLQNGGKILATGLSGLNEDKTAFAFEKEWGVRFKAEKTFEPAYFRMCGSLSSLVPDLPLTANANCLEVEALDGSEVVGKIVAPYYNKGWDGIYSNFYTPPKNMTEMPFAVLANQTAYCSAQLFAGYYKAASVELRYILGAMLKHLLAEPLVEVTSGLASFSRVFVSEQPNRNMVHLLNYIPELRGEMLIVEEALEANNINIRLRLDGKKVKSVSLAPCGTALDFTVNGNYVEFTVPSIKGYGMAVVEF